MSLCEPELPIGGEVDRLASWDVGRLANRQSKNVVSEVSLLTNEQPLIPVMFESILQPPCLSTKLGQYVPGVSPSRKI